MFTDKQTAHMAQIKNGEQMLDIGHRYYTLSYPHQNNNKKPKTQNNNKTTKARERKKPTTAATWWEGKKMAPVPVSGKKNPKCSHSSSGKPDANLGNLCCGSPYPRRSSWWISCPFSFWLGHSKSGARIEGPLIIPPVPGCFKSYQLFSLISVTRNILFHEVVFLMWQGSTKGSNKPHRLILRICLCWFCLYKWIWKVRPSVLKCFSMRLMLCLLILLRTFCSLVV